MLSVHFVRHGKRERWPGDPPLTREGRRDAERIAEHLVTAQPAAVVTSPLSRARETAEIIGRVLGLDVTEDTRLRERMNWGDLEGQSLEEFLAEWERCSRDRDRQPPVGDSSREAGARIASFVAECSGGDVIAVTHGGVLADFLLNAFSPAELRAVRPEFCVDPYSGDVVRECSITTVTYDAGRFGLRGIGLASLGDRDAPS